MYAVELPARPVEAWAEHGAIVDAVARGDAERARALTALHAERTPVRTGCGSPRCEVLATFRKHGGRPPLTMTPYTKSESNSRGWFPLPPKRRA